MLSNKFYLFVLVGIVLVVGFGIYPAFNTFFRTINTQGLDTEMLGIQRLFPYFLFGVVFYAAYIVYKRGK
jgi:hypothetical protein